MLIIIFRLFDSNYGQDVNKETLAVRLDGNVLRYSLYGGWQDSGIEFSISNLQLKESLPMNAKRYKNTYQIADEVRRILKTGVGSNDVKTFEVLNELPKKVNNAPTKRGIAEAQANARLIASAPELLEACQYVVKWHKENDSGEGELFGLDFVTTCISAITKATQS